MSSFRREATVIDLSDPDELIDQCVTTPATSVSSDGQVITELSGEAQAFLQILDNYVAIGCLVNDQNFQIRPEITSVDDSDWQELSVSWLGFPESLVDDAQKLITNGWIRIFSRKILHPACIFRVYVLPSDIGHRFVDHSNKTLSTALKTLVRELDISQSVWNGQMNRNEIIRFDPYAALDEGSLYWLFNTIPSPAPSAENIKSHFHHDALASLLDPATQILGLKTQLYPYQRRSTGLMLQKESEGRLELDPRLEQRVAPDGSMYFYAPRDGIFLRSPRFYESCKGGILAETMGLGKTLICIALILSTKGHLPQVPVQYETIRTRPKVGSLAEMAASAINKHSAPWKPYFDELANLTGEHMTQCIKLMRQNAPTYEIPLEPIRWNRNATLPPPKVLTLAPTTIIVVPRNLFAQWTSELEKHTQENSLAILYMDDPKKALPSASELVLYDLILFSQPRFEAESRDGLNSKGQRLSRYPKACTCTYKGATNTPDCTCLRAEDLYDSPLKYIHFLRMIVDEGHLLTSPTTKAAQVANGIVQASHRWVVSGTPSKDLLGVEMDFIVSDSANLSKQEQRQESLQQRRQFSTKEDTSGAIDGIGYLVSNFLKIRPWAACRGERPAEWKHEIYRNKDARFSKHGISGFSTCLRRVLEGIVVKTQAEDVERDIELPPLDHRIVRLKPSFYDKLTANTFVFVLTTNAVTSERSDTDYLFHKNSRKDRCHLVSNLRQSAFSWTGFSEGDILATIKNSEGYLEKENTTCNQEDRLLLRHCVEQAKQMLMCPGWVALGKSHEIGIFVEDWPEDSAQFWSFDQDQLPLLSGVTQILAAQAHVNWQAASVDPSEGLPGIGLRELAVLRKPMQDAGGLLKSGIPSSSVKGQPAFHRSTLTKEANPTKTQTKAKASRSKPSRTKGSGMVEPSSASPSNEPEQQEPQQLPDGSHLRRTNVIGTTSSKLSYLLSKIQKLHHQEKILVFYDANNAAFYIAQALDLLHISHLIYAGTLTPAQRSNYIVKFEKDPDCRVLLMDVQQASHGLNVSSASRVFFVNFCRPQIEAQAIKRAHRIGQNKPVVVETLLLEGTIEEKMFDRARQMTRDEHTNAKVLDDDGGIAEIIQAARLLPLSDNERAGLDQVAQLEEPQQLWSRSGWVSWKKAQDEIAKKPNKRKAVQLSAEDTAIASKKRKTSGAETTTMTTESTELESVGQSQASVSRERTASVRTGGRGRASIFSGLP